MNVYIVFSEVVAGMLKIALRDLGVIYEGNVILISDNFSIGPLWQLQEKIGRQERFEWLRKSISYSPYDYFEEEYPTKFEQALSQLETVPEEVSITILCGENAHEQTGVRYVLRLLEGRANRIYIINTTEIYNNYFKRQDVQYFVSYTGEISPQEIKLILEKSKLDSPLNGYERDRLVQEGNILIESKEVLRIWVDRQINSVSENYYDNNIINSARQMHKNREEDCFIKSARIIGDVLGYLDQYVGDQFLEYRLRHLIDIGIFEVEGSLEAMRYYSVRLEDND